jgi:hypothetical protein
MLKGRLGLTVLNQGAPRTHEHYDTIDHYLELARQHTNRRRATTNKKAEGNASETRIWCAIIATGGQPQRHLLEVAKQRTGQGHGHHLQNSIVRVAGTLI